MFDDPRGPLFYGSALDSGIFSAPKGQGLADALYILVGGLNPSEKYYPLVMTNIAIG